MICNTKLRPTMHVLADNSKMKHIWHGDCEINRIACYILYKLGLSRSPSSNRSLWFGARGVSRFFSWLPRWKRSRARFLLKRMIPCLQPWFLLLRKCFIKHRFFILNVMIILRSKIAGQSAQKLILQSPLPLLLPPFYKIQSDHIHQNKPNI